MLEYNNSNCDWGSMTELEIAINRSDYYSALADYGFTHATAREQSENDCDLSLDPIDGVYVGESDIEGYGLFSSKTYGFGDFVCVARVEGIRTIAGRYTNHAKAPNAFFTWADGEIILIAAQKIKPDDEILVDYRAALSLQILSEGNKAAVLVSNKDLLAVEQTERLELGGIAAAAYDLLFNDDHVSNLSLRERVLAFESILQDMPQEEIPAKHEFIKGLYKREITFKKGTLATGKIHTEDHMDVVLSGSMIVATDDGFAVIEGPCFRTSIAGRKKAGYALTDCVWATYHPTDKTTVAEVEAEIFAEDFREITADFTEEVSICQA
jgi:hypothetical protein